VYPKSGVAVRQYYPIWHKLKSMPLTEASSKGVSVTANRLLHPRIIKAVVKEKWMDIEHKLEVEPATLILYHERKGAILTFYLRQSMSKLNEGCV
jgi:hypothetical protein